jgi:hypothetical protein
MRSEGHGQVTEIQIAEQETLNRGHNYISFKLDTVLFYVKLLTSAVVLHTAVSMFSKDKMSHIPSASLTNQMLIQREQTLTLTAFVNIHNRKYIKDIPKIKF